MICTTCPEKPHIGNCGVPFMNSTTSLLLTSFSMNCSIAIRFPLQCRRSAQRPATLSSLIICSASRPRAQGASAEHRFTFSPICATGRPRLAGAEPVVSAHWRSLSALGGTGLQGKRVQLAAHFRLERVIDDLVLLHPRFPAK